jgi:hypothetical protein
MLDETLKKLGLKDTTKVTLHDQQPRKVRPVRASQPIKLPVTESIQHDTASEAKGSQTSAS